MKRMLSLILLLAISLLALAVLPGQAAGAPVVSTETDSIVPFPEDSGGTSAVWNSAAGTYDTQTAASGSTALPFTDVKPGSWYYEYVANVYARGLMNGTSSTKFAPDATLSRAEAVTVLYRLAGSPAVSGSSGFLDVPGGTYYTDAVTWAASQGIVSGVSSTEFRPKEYITREQLAAILCRYYGAYGSGAATQAADLSRFPDSKETSNYAVESMAWAVGVGLIQGVDTGSGTYLQPRSTSTRAQMATILSRFLTLAGSGGTGLSSQAIIDFIKAREGFTPTPYWDYSQYTIGYGTCCGLTRDEVPEEYWDGITEELAEELLRAEITNSFEPAVNAYAEANGLTLTQNEFDALVSFTFNLGPGWTNGGYRINNWLENRSTELELVWSMGVWCRAGGSVLTGLCSRRIGESEIFLYGDYTGGGDHTGYRYVRYTGGGSYLVNQYTDDVGYYVLGSTYGELPVPVWRGVGESTAASIAQSPEEPLTPAAAPAFLGWFTSDGVQVTSGTVVEQNQTLTARWSK